MNQFIARKYFLNKLFHIFHYLFFFLIIVFPIFFILGPAPTEISCVLLSLFGIFIFLTKKEYKKINIFFIVLLLFYVSINISSILSNEKYEAFSRSLISIRLIFMIISIHYILIYFKKYFKYLIYVIIASFVFIYVDDIFQFYFGVDFFGFPKQNHRLSGPFGDELIPGTFLLRYGLIVIVVALMNVNKNIYYLSFILLSLLQLFGVMITGEKASSILCILLLLLFSFATNKLKQSLFFVIIICFVFISMFIYLSNKNEMYFDRIMTETTRTLGISSERDFFDSEHGVMFLTSMHIAKDNPIFGIGLKNYRVVCADEKYSKISSLVVSERCSTHPHNYYMELLAETGLLGFLLFITLLFLLFKDLLKKYLRKKNNILLGLIITLFVIFWPLSFTFSLFTNFNIIWISYFIALTYSISDKKFYA